MDQEVLSLDDVIKLRTLKIQSTNHCVLLNKKNIKSCVFWLCRTS